MEQEQTVDLLEVVKPGETPLPDGAAALPVRVNEGPPVVYKTFATASDMRSHIFQVKDIKEEMVKIPEWGVEIKVKGLTGQQRALTMKASMGADGQPDLQKMYAHMVVFGCHHPVTNEKVFNLADMDALMREKSGGVIERLAMLVSNISGLDQGAAQTIEKN